MVFARARALLVDHGRWQRWRWRLAEAEEAGAQLCNCATVQGFVSLRLVGTLETIVSACATLFGYL